MGVGIRSGSVKVRSPVSLGSDMEHASIQRFLTA
jgi:hypothetical protein